MSKIRTIFICLVVILPFFFIFAEYQDIFYDLKFIPTDPYYETSLQLIKSKIYFMYLPYYKPLFDYQKSLIQNCDSIEEADYLVMGINSYFKDQGYKKLNWSRSFTDLVFSKKIIMLSEEDVTINKPAFNFSYHDKITAVIGPNEEKDLQEYFNTTNVFSHLIFELYFNNHKAPYKKFIKRNFFIQTAISNINYFVNSGRNEYLKACMNFFGSEKIANYGRLFHNRNYSSNGQFNRLPSDAFFGFSMENSIADYWITEKVFFMYRNDVIPIYRGSVKNREILKNYGVNTNAFVDASNMTSDELVSYLNKLITEKGKKKLYDIYRQPLIPDRAFFNQQIRDNYKKVIDYLEKQKNHKKIVLF